jgi:hypothetical protein
MLVLFVIIIALTAAPMSFGWLLLFGLSLYARKLENQRIGYHDMTPEERRDISVERWKRGIVGGALLYAAKRGLKNR